MSANRARRRDKHARVATDQQASGQDDDALPSQQRGEEGHTHGQDMESGHNRCGWLMLTHVGVSIGARMGERTHVVSLPVIGREGEGGLQVVRMLVRDRAVRGVDPELQQGVGMSVSGTRPVVAGQEEHPEERQTPQERATRQWSKDSATSQGADRYFPGRVELESLEAHPSPAPSVSRAPGQIEKMPLSQPR
jgi:hypothetical protein